MDSNARADLAGAEVCNAVGTAVRSGTGGKPDRVAAVRAVSPCFLHSAPAKDVSAPGGTRTPSLRIRNPLLYPIELRARLHVEQTHVILSDRTS